MTIIAYDANEDVIYSDSLHVYNSGRPPCIMTKVTSMRGYTYVSAGTWMSQVVDEIVISALERGEQHGVLPPGLTAEMFIRAQDGTVACVYGAEGYFTVQRASSPEQPFFQGSGSAWAHAYHSLGHSIEECVHLVALHHNECGLPIQRS